MGNEDNFQNNFIKLMEIIGGKKSVFRKTSIHDMRYFYHRAPYS